MQMGGDITQHLLADWLEVLQQCIVGVDAGNIGERELAQLGKVLECCFLLWSKHRQGQG